MGCASILTDKFDFEKRAGQRGRDREISFTQIGAQNRPSPSEEEKRIRGVFTFVKKKNEKRAITINGQLLGVSVATTEIRFHSQVTVGLVGRQHKKQRAASCGGKRLGEEKQKKSRPAS